MLYYFVWLTTYLVVLYTLRMILLDGVEIKTTYEYRVDYKEVIKKKYIKLFLINFILICWFVFLETFELTSIYIVSYIFTFLYIAYKIELESVRINNLISKNVIRLDKD